MEPELAIFYKLSSLLAMGVGHQCSHKNLLMQSALPESLGWGNCGTEIVGDQSMTGPTWGPIQEKGAHAWRCQRHNNPETQDRVKNDLPKKKKPIKKFLMICCYTYRLVPSPFRSIIQQLIRGETETHSQALDGAKGVLQKRGRKYCRSHRNPGYQKKKAYRFN